MSAAGPDIAGLLASLGAGGAPPATADAGAEAPPAPETPMDDPSQGDQGQDTSDPLAFLQDMIDSGRQFIDGANDPQDEAAVSQCIAKLRQILAAHEKEQLGAMQGKVAPRQLKKAAMAQGGGYA